MAETGARAFVNGDSGKAGPIDEPAGTLAASPRPREPRPRWPAPFALMVVLALFGLRAVEIYWQHPLGSIDGAMQTWVSVDAFASGEQLGQDFQSYLGITMMLFLIPLFLLGGGTLFASTLSAHFAVFLGVSATLFGLLGLIRGMRPATRWLLFALLFALLFFSPLSEPGNSLRPLRWALPFFLLPFVLVLLRRIGEGPLVLPALGTGLAAGVALLWSNDAGIPTFASLLFALLLFGVGRRSLLALGLVLLGAAVSAGLILAIVTHGAPSGWFTYNFLAVPRDQIWYFAPWRRETRVLEPQDLWLIFAAMRGRTLVVFLLLCGSIAVALLYRALGRGDPVVLSAFVFLGLSTLGIVLLPQIGGHITSGYNWGVLLIGLAGPIIVFQHHLPALQDRFVRLRPPRWAIFATLCVTAILGATALAARQALDLVAASRDRIYVPELGFPVAPATADDAVALRRLRALLDAAGVPDNRRLLSTYTSAVDIILGSERPTEFGSIIHALGPGGRQRFRDVVEERQVAFVTTIHPRFSGWAAWNLRADWPFFAALHRGYVPVARSKQHVLWQRRRVPLDVAAQETTCTIAPTAHGGARVSVTAPVADLMQLDVTLEDPPPPRRSAILVATETSPDMRDPPAPLWNDAPRYGVEVAPRLSLVVPAEPGEASAVELAMMDGTPLRGAGCRATLARWPDVDDLPSFRAFVGGLGRGGIVPGLPS